MGTFSVLTAPNSHELFSPSRKLFIQMGGANSFPAWMQTKTTLHRACLKLASGQVTDAEC